MAAGGQGSGALSYFEADAIRNLAARIVSRRDLFAMAAMHALISDPKAYERLFRSEPADLYQLAQKAYGIADAMIMQGQEGSES